MYEKLALFMVMGALVIIVSIMHFVNLRDERRIDKLKQALHEAKEGGQYLQSLLVSIDEVTKKDSDSHDKIIVVSQILDNTRCKCCGSPAGSRWYKDITKSRDFKELLCPACIDSKRQP